MADFLFVTWDGGGNVPPALTIASELRARGHTTRFLGHASQRPALVDAGVEVVAGSHARDFSSLAGPSLVEILAAFTDRGIGQDLLDAVRQREPDLVVIDCFMFAAMDAARRAGLRYAVLEHLYDSYYEHTARKSPLGLVPALRGMHVGKALDAAQIRLVTTLAQLDRVSRRAQNLRQVGPIVSASSPVPGEPTILVSLSTFGFPGMADVLQRVIDATEGLGAKVIVTSGPAVDPGSLTVPAHVEVHRYIPHADVMPRATVVVGHGGHGTTMQALAHDLPLLILPMDGKTDQPAVGRSLVGSGAGLVLKKSARPPRIAAALSRLLADGPHRTAARELGAAIRATDGAGRGADALGELVDGPDARGAASQRVG